MVDRIRPALGLQAESRPGTVDRPALSPLPRQEVGGVELEPGLGGPALQHQSAAPDHRRPAQWPRRGAVQDEIVVIAIAQNQLGMLPGQSL